MNLDSVRAFKQEVSDAIVEAAGTDPATVSFFAASEPPMPHALALGVAKEGDQFVVAIRTDAPALAEHLKDRAGGEADVRIIKVTKRTTPAFLQGTVRPLEPGAQVGMANKNFVGTLGGLVRDAAGRLYILSNSHVLADEGTAQPGHRIGQPFGTTPIALLERFIPFSTTTPNLVDCAIARLDHTSILGEGWNGALQDRIAGVREVTPDDLGSDATKIGRTTGVRKGKVTAIEIDGLPVGYDVGVLRFNDQVEISGGPATDFSAAGDSGSLIVSLRDRKAIGLLFAGGKDGSGEDFTYANRLTSVLGALGVELVF